MVLGINETLNVTSAGIETLLNSTGYADLAINVNHIIFNGWLYTIILLLLWMILFINAYYSDGQILTNLVMTGAIISIVSVFLRMIYLITDGVWRGLLTDAQMWIFPILTLLFMILAWISKE